MRGGKRCIWVALILLSALGTLCLVFIISDRNRATLSRRLPDGTIVSIVEVNYGKVHRYVPGNLLQKLAGRLLPEKFSHHLDAYPLIFTNTSDSIGVFVECFKTNGTFSAFPAMAFNISTQMRGSDAAGNGFLLYQVLEGGSSNRYIAGFRSQSLPYSEKLILHFRLSTYSSGGHSYETEFIVPNPAPHSPQSQSAPALPVTNRTGILDLESRQPGTAR